MRASRDIDLKIVERVMGWRYDPARTFNPSGNIVQAFEVVDALNHAGIAVRLEQVRDAGENLFAWRCEVSDAKGTFHSALEPTAAQAICVASLLCCPEAGEPVDQDQRAPFSSDARSA